MTILPLAAGGEPSTEQSLVARVHARSDQDRAPGRAAPLRFAEDFSGHARALQPRRARETQSRRRVADLRSPLAHLLLVLAYLGQPSSRLRRAEGSSPDDGQPRARGSWPPG